ncbi:hypothetical protein CPC08DRAFT_713219, partial [Agrocybe pediades]
MDRPENGISCATELFAVCRTWCDIVRSCPLLWTNVSIHARIILSQEAEAHLLVKEWLARSKTLPIDLYVFGTRQYRMESPFPYPSHCEGPSNIQLATVLAESSNRWRSISFNVPASFVHQLCDIAHDLSQLRYVKYGYKCFRGDWNDVSFQWRERLSPRKLKLRSELSSSLLEAFNVQTDSLTYLKVNSMTTDRCIDIIRLSPMLRFFETGLSNEGVMPHSPTVHNVLESFSLLWSPRPGLVDQVLSSLTLPRLHTLNLDLVGDHDKNIIEDFLHRSAAPITSMEL